MQLDYLLKPFPLSRCLPRHVKKLRIGRIATSGENWIIIASKTSEGQIRSGISVNYSFAKPLEIM